MHALESRLRSPELWAQRDLPLYAALIRAWQAAEGRDSEHALRLLGEVCAEPHPLRGGAGAIHGLLMAALSLPPDRRTLPLRALLALARTRGAIDWSRVWNVQVAAAESKADEARVVEEMVGAGVRPTTVTFNTRLRNLARWGGTLDEAEALLTAMRHAQVPRDEVTFNTLLRLARTPSEADRVEALRREEKVPVTDRTLTARLIIAALHGGDDELQAASAALPPAQAHYALNARLLFAARTGDEAAILTAVDALKGGRLVRFLFERAVATTAQRLPEALPAVFLAMPDEMLAGSSLDTLIHLLALTQDPSRVRALEDRLPQVSSAELLRFHAVRGDQAAFALTWNRMEAQSAPDPPSPRAWTARLRLAHRLGDCAEARAVWALIKAQGLRPSDTAVGLLLDLHARHPEEHRELASLFDALSRDPLTPRLNRRTCHSLLHAWLERGESGRALALLQTMAEGVRAATPDTTTINIVLGGTLKHEDTAQAIDAALDTYLGTLQAQQLRPDGFTFNTVMWHAAQRLDWSAMERVLGRMEDAGVAPDAITFNILLSYHVRRRDDAALARTLASMDAARVRPTTLTFVPLLRFYTQQGALGETGVQRVLEQMARTQVPLDQGHCLVLLVFYAHLGALPQADTLLQHMLAHGPPPTAQHYSILLEMHTRRGAAGLPRLLGLIEEMRQRGLEPQELAPHMLRRFKWGRRLEGRH